MLPTLREMQDQVRAKTKRVNKHGIRHGVGRASDVPAPVKTNQAVNKISSYKFSKSKANITVGIICLEWTVQRSCAYCSFPCAPLLVRHQLRTPLAQMCSVRVVCYDCLRPCKPEKCKNRQPHDVHMLSKLIPGPILGMEASDGNG